MLAIVFPVTDFVDRSWHLAGRARALVVALITLPPFVIIMGLIVFLYTLVKEVCTRNKTPKTKPEGIPNGIYLVHSNLEEMDKTLAMQEGRDQSRGEAEGGFTPRTRAGTEALKGATEDRMNDRREGPERLLLYIFEHVTLPEAVFQNHPELIRELETPHSWATLQHMQSKAIVRCNQLGLSEDYEDMDQELEAVEELFRGLAVHPYLRNGYTVHVITMPLPKYVPEAYFAAIVHKDDEPKQGIPMTSSTRYFTLEKSDERLPILCEWTRGHSRLNFGEGPAPDETAFLEAVFTRIAA